MAVTSVLPATREIHALMAFRNDPILEELRGALSRVDNGTFGICLGCKRTMAPALLTNDPMRRFCFECEGKLNHHTHGEFSPTYVVFDEVL
jgi:RNA polymerase-binding transcription factor DksA